MGDLNYELNRLAGTTGLDAQGAANVYAGTVGKDLVGALNVKAGTSGLELLGVLNKLAGTTGKDLLAALAAIPNGPAGITLSGASGCNASTPDSAALSNTVDIDVRIRLSLTDWTPATTNAIFSKFNQVAGQKSWMLIADTDGTLAAYFSTDGSAASSVSSAAHSFADGSRNWIRMTRTKADGVVSFYKAADAAAIPTVWTSLGGGGAVLAGSGIFDSTTVVRLGGVGGLAWDATGNIRQGVIYDSVGGTITANADFTVNGSPQAVAGASTYTDAQGNVWTMNSGAVISSA